jgi:hypothetical protein
MHNLILKKYIHTKMLSLSRTLLAGVLLYVGTLLLSLWNISSPPSCSTSSLPGGAASDSHCFHPLLEHADILTITIKEFQTSEVEKKTDVLFPPMCFSAEPFSRSCFGSTRHP